MAAAAAISGQFEASWPVAAVVAVTVLAGISAGGYTGVAYAEFAALGGARRTEATGLGTALMFAGGMLIPPAFGASVTTLGGYGASYLLIAILTLAGGVLLGWQR